MDVSNTIVHFYRASVMHADVWRRRLDVTSNWAVVSTAAIVTFAFSSVAHPHFILLLSLVFVSFFLVMESRRYQMYNLWRQRVQMLNRFVVAPALAPNKALDPDRVEAELEALAAELGSTVPHLSFWDAVGYRLRRNYALLFGAISATWLLKVWYHPKPATDLASIVDRASVGALPGAVVLAGVALGLILAFYLAATARTERMVDWTELPSPLGRAGGSESRERETSLLPDLGPRQFPKG